MAFNRLVDIGDYRRMYGQIGEGMPSWIEFSEEWDDPDPDSDYWAEWDSLLD